MTTNTPKMLRRVDAAKYITETYSIPCSPKTLAKIACVGSDGPPFRLAGRFPLYPVDGLDAWAMSKIGPLVRSTSELPKKERMDAMDWALSEETEDAIQEIEDNLRNARIMSPRIIAD